MNTDPEPVLDHSILPFSPIKQKPVMRLDSKAPLTQPVPFIDGVNVMADLTRLAEEGLAGDEEARKEWRVMCKRAEYREMPFFTKLISADVANRSVYLSHPNSFAGLTAEQRAIFEVVDVDLAMSGVSVEEALRQ